MYYLRHIALGQCWPIGIFCLMLYNQSNFYIFEETSNYWSRVFSKIFIGQVSISLLFIGHHLGSTFIGTDRYSPNDRIGPKRD